MDIRCEDCLSFIADDKLIETNRKKTRWVVALTSATMVLEVVMGYISGSMALTAEGWHMASHAGALLIALFAYRLAKSQTLSKHFSFGAGKLLPLGGYTSAIVLGLVALFIFFESVSRLFSPIEINFNEAIGIAFFGLCINILSALILNDDHDHGHDHDHKHIHDHNLRSAFLHVLADAVTAVLAISALLIGKFYHILWLDSVVGIVGSAVIFSWAFSLCRDTGWELLDGHSKTVDWKKLKSVVEVDGAKILDFHVWRIAPRATACELVVGSKSLRGFDYYRQLLREEFSIQHIIVEERPI